VVPRELEPAENKRISNLMEHFAHKNRDVMGIIWDGQQTLDFVTSMSIGDNEAAVPSMDILKVLATADMQFGRGAGDILMGMKDTEDPNKYDVALSESSFRKSKKTGRIRNVQHNGEHIFSFRASDGYMSLKPAGAERLRASIPSPALRVIVSEDSAEFNRDGKSVFAKFVIDADENLRPGDEVLVVDEKDSLVAVGRALMTRDEMMAFNIGTAVKVREGVK
jgi:7-cyano-7-deazaguanine tRNA-ribosyltransferase